MSICQFVVQWTPALTAPPIAKISLISLDMGASLRPGLSISVSSFLAFFLVSFSLVVVHSSEK